MSYEMKFTDAEKFRVKTGVFATKEGDEFGLFHIKPINGGAYIKTIVAPSSSNWQHVSCSLPSRVPNWDEMNMVKNIFWDSETTVVQFHPKHSEYVDNCKTCLHLWRNVHTGHELPPSRLVGIKS